MDRPTTSAPRVLIVDASVETREVLRTALARGGADVLEAAHTAAALELTRRRQPDVVVLDLDLAAACDPAWSTALHAETARRQTPLLILGTARRAAERFPAGQFVPKPYHYGPLIHKIEDLLAASGHARAA